jgi:hypothetical protein
VKLPPYWTVYAGSKPAGSTLERRRLPMTAREEQGVAGDARPQYMTVEQYAEHRQVCRTTAFHWIALGMPSVKQGGTRRVRREDADAWLDDGNANFKSAAGKLRKAS